ncbi:hypothetical protein O6H91_11G050700 [Diphasiastrum complanatum]|uniref:Uncharacterized protein n=1 Tax=Diphasiastrum complanatum TaxID=34168 RepID=A0ACC2C9D0_DIPCM|nr:hypothetical protein O6H91_11G050700 [Diphasiastrum complanatum]
MISYLPNAPPPWPLDEPDGSYPFWLPPPIDHSDSSTSKTSILTPAVVAVIAILGSAFLLVSYYRIFARYCSTWRDFPGVRWRRRSAIAGEEQPSMEAEEAWVVVTNGLDEYLIRKIPVFTFKKGEGVTESTECVVCLTEFEEEEPLRLLPKCSHAFHLPCVDMWLQTHTNCPLCRANVFKENPVSPPQAQAAAESVSGADGAPLGMESVTPEAGPAGQVMASLEDPVEATAKTQGMEDVKNDSALNSPKLYPSRSPCHPILITGIRKEDQSQKLISTQSLALEINAMPPLLRRSNSTGSHIGVCFSDTAEDSQPRQIQQKIFPCETSGIYNIASPKFRRSFSGSFISIDMSDIGSCSSSAETLLSPSQDLEKIRCSNFANSTLSVTKLPTAKTFLARTFSGRRVFPFRTNKTHSSTGDSSVARV